MLVNEKNKEKIEKMIIEAEGRATARTIKFENILEDIKQIEKKLNITKKAMTGVTVDVDHNAQDFPKAYKYTPDSTQYTIVRKSSGWDLVTIERWHTRKDGQTFIVKLTEEAKEAILKNMQCF